MSNKNRITITVRHANKSDIEGMLSIERSRYAEIYDNNPKALNDVEQRFRRRIKVAQSWMWVAEISGQIVGFITGQPTNSEPQDFKSWEESTDNGTLEKTFDPTGKNVYVVNLDVSREATKNNAQYMLMAQLGAKGIREGKDKVIFESRMPEFRNYVYKELRISEQDWLDTPREVQKNIAEKYSNLTIVKNGKKVKKDRLLRFYDQSGFNLAKVFANAFKDPESLDYGMLCTGGNPVPKKLRIKPVNLVVAKLFEKIGKNPKLLEKMVG
jgi:hypothetical protein